ncbi:MAG: SH3 domain-containing protein [Balneolales bacterium]
MALKKCKECKKEISTKAKNCPYCGAKKPTDNQLVNFLIGLGFIIFFIWIFTGKSETDPSINPLADRFSNTSLNIRSGPGTNYKTISALDPGEQIRVLADSIGWLNIRSVENDAEGWVSESYTSEISGLANWLNEQKAEQQRQRAAERATAWQRQDNSNAAYINIEDFVEDRLVSPSTAEFPGVLDGRRDHVQYLGNHRYRIRSYVDSQNRFGATLRTHFVGEIRQTSERNWRLESLEMSE